MAALSTLDFRVALANQPTEWLKRCLEDWRLTKTATITCDIWKYRAVAMIRRELRQRTPALYIDVSTETAYGLTTTHSTFRVY